MTDVLEGTLPADAAPRPRRGALERHPLLYVLLECDRPLALSSRHSLAGVSTVIIGRGNRREFERRGRSLHVRIPDRWMSSTHVSLRKAQRRWLLEDAGSRNGTLVGETRVDKHTLVDGDIIEVGHTLLVFRDEVEIDPEDPVDVDAAAHMPPAPGMLTAVPAMERELAMLRQIAPAEVGILLYGESGTGKEVIARAIARLSRRKGAFVGVNCGGIPDQLIESEMFGVVKGAFTGATADRPGLVRTSDGGTRDVPVDLRVISATHRDLEGMVGSGDFRTDLYARLAGFRLTLLPLRARRDDLGILIGSLLLGKLAGAARTVTFECAAVRAMYRYHWPLNIRELENALGTAQVLAAGDPIAVHHLPEQIREARAPVQAGDGLTPDEEQHRAELVALLEQHGGNISAVARATGKARQQVHRWLKRYHLDPDRYR